MKYLILAALTTLGAGSSVASAGIDCSVTHNLASQVIKVYQQELPFSANKYSYKSEGYELILSSTSIRIASADLYYKGKQVLLGSMKIMPGAYMSILAATADGGTVGLSCVDTRPAND